MSTLALIIAAIAALLNPHAEADFQRDVHDAYPYVSGTQATEWVKGVCAVFRDGYDFYDMPGIDDADVAAQYLFILEAGVPIYCPDQIGALS